MATPSAAPAADGQQAAGTGQDVTPPPAEKSAVKAGTLPAKAALDRPGKPSSKAKPAKAPGKSAAKSQVQAKMAARMAQAKIKEKKIAEAKRAALNTSKRKTAPTTNPAVSAGLGQ